METSLEDGTVVDDLYRLFDLKCGESTNYRDQKFLSVEAIDKSLTRPRIEAWFARRGIDDTDLIEKICNESCRLLFIALILAKLEHLIPRLVRQALFTDSALFDTTQFQQACKSGRLTEKEQTDLEESRNRIGIVLEDSRLLELPEGCILPYHARENSRSGSNATIYKVKIARGHIRYDQDTVADRQIRADTDRKTNHWKDCEREVEILQQRRHPNIIKLLGSYYLDTVDTSHKLNRTLHLIFPWAELDLRNWMTLAKNPMEGLQDHREYIYHSICGLAAGVSFLHTAQAGRFTSHHDLKPANILIVEGQFQISDFDRSHLRSINEGSATEQRKTLGTPEYQPPEYWKTDGRQSDISHGRAFDVWALGCIIIELATLAALGWSVAVNGSNYQPVSLFRKRRFDNEGVVKEFPEETPTDEQSFWNNYNVVKDWVNKLKSHDSDAKLKNILDIALEMTAFRPKDRMYMWEAELDLYENFKETLKSPTANDTKIKPKAPLSDPSFYYPINIRESGDEVSWKLSVVANRITHPLHRAARAGNRKRVIQLWSLGWPILVRDSKGQTPLSIMQKSDNVELRSLEGDVTNLLNAARNGQIEIIRNLIIEKHLHPGMVDRNGHSALIEAIKNKKADVVRLLLTYAADDQLSGWTWNDDCFRKVESKMIELMEAAYNDDAATIRDVVKEEELSPDMRYITGDSPTLIAKRHSHYNANYAIYQSGADLRKLQWRWWNYTYDEQPLHTAARLGFVEGLKDILNHDHEEGNSMINRPCRERDLIFHEAEKRWSKEDCIDYRTPLFLAAQHGHDDAVKLLLGKGASLFLPQFEGKVDYCPRVLFFRTALEAAIKSNNKKVLDLVFEAPGLKKCLELKDQYCQPPLLQAISRGNTGCFERLLKEGANLHVFNNSDIEDRRGWSVVQYLALQGLHETLQQHIDEFSMVQLTYSGSGAQDAPRKLAKRHSHPEIVRVIDKRLRDLGDSWSGSKTQRILSRLF